MKQWTEELWQQRQVQLLLNRQINNREFETPDSLLTVQGYAAYQNLDAVTLRPQVDALAHDLQGMVHEGA